MLNSNCIPQYEVKLKIKIENINYITESVLTLNIPQKNDTWEHKF